MLYKRLTMFAKNASFIGMGLNYVRLHAFLFAEYIALNRAAIKDEALRGEKGGERANLEIIKEVRN